MGRLPDDRRLHQAALAYASDLTLLGVTTVPHERLHRAECACRLHRPRHVVSPAVRADEWLLYDQISPSASSGLGWQPRRLFQNSILVSSVAQEGLIRPAPPAPERADRSDATYRSASLGSRSASVGQSRSWRAEER